MTKYRQTKINQAMDLVIDALDNGLTVGFSDYDVKIFRNGYHLMVCCDGAILNMKVPPDQQLIMSAKETRECIGLA